MPFWLRKVNITKESKIKSVVINIFKTKFPKYIKLLNYNGSRTKILVKIVFIIVDSKEYGIKLLIR